MAVLAISALGAGLGGLTGISGAASVGWLVGSLLGNALFAKGSKVEGPRLGDLTVQSATEGAPIAIAYGTGRLAGNLIWSPGIVEVKTKKKVGGKGLGGKSSSTTYTYKASFAVGLADRSTDTPIQGVRKIWADGKLIYNSSSTASAATIYSSRKKLASITMYPGSSTQTADPTIQAAQGAANTPAFRYLAYIVFKDFQLADFANRIPNITAEIVCAGTGTAPYQVASWNPEVGDPITSAFRDGVIEQAEYSYDVGFLATYLLTTRNLNGVLLSSEKKTFQLSVSAVPRFGPVTGSPRSCYIQYQGVGAGIGSSAMVYENVYQPSLVPYQSGNYYSAIATGGNTRHACIQSGYLFSIQFESAGTTGIARRYRNANGTAQASADRFASTVLFSSLSAGDDGLIYAMSSSTPNIVAYDTDLNQIATYNYPSPYTTEYEFTSGIVVRDGLLMDFNVYSGFTRCRLFTLTSPTLTFVNEIAMTPASSLNARILSLGNGLALHSTGVFSMYPPVTPSAITLASVVTNLCARCGLTAGQINVTALTDAVDFYAIGRHVAGRAGIEPLMQAYYFDAVESGAVLKFVKRGGASQATFTEDDLGFGDGSSALVKTSRQQEYELPIQVNIGHMDINNDYQPGTQNARRLISPSKVVTDLDFPMAFSSAKAAQIAEVLQLNAWTERMRYAMQATRKHAHLEPTDIITLPSGELARIVSSELSDNGALQFEAVADAVAMYSPVAVGNDSVSNVPQDVPTAGPTLALIIDIPALETSGNAPGFYLSSAGYYSGWRGAEILISADSGVSYAGVYAVTNDAVIGYTTTALANVALPHQLDVLGSVTVSLITTTYTLSSITDDQVLAGGNLCAIRSGTAWELLQFGTATLVSAGVYTLSRFMRARFGTELLTAGHLAGDAFVLITADELNFIARPQADVNVSRLLKAATFGDTYADTEAQEFTSTGRSQQPLAPVHLAAAASRITGDWSFAWVRRARLNFWWLDIVEMALDEATEAYRVEILNAAGAVARTIDIAAALTTTYTKLQQETDLGGMASSLAWRVCQRSALIGNGQFAAQTALGPAFGPPRNVMLSHLPVLLIYTWTSTTVTDDVSLSNLDGTFVGVPTVNLSPTGILGDTATRFMSTSAGIYATIPHSAKHTFSGNFAAGVWAKWTVVHGPEGHIVGKSDALGSTQYQLTAFSTGQLWFYCRFGGQGRNLSHSGGWNDGLWHFIVAQVKYSAAGTHTMELWVDGVLRTSLVNPETAALDPNTLAFTAGASSTGANQFTGDIGPVMLFGQALTGAQILALYNNARTT